MFERLSQFTGLLQQAREMRGKIEGMSEQLRGVKVEGASGGGLVSVEMNGLMELVRCKIDPGLFAQQDREMVEDLVVAAVNQAQQKAKEANAQAMQGIVSGAGIPGIDEVTKLMFGDKPAE